MVPLACFLVRCQPIRSARVRSGDIDSGGYSCGAPPLPIPNREVKPARADGTAPQSGRVGRRRLREGLLAGFPAGRFFFFVFIEPKVLIRLIISIVSIVSIVQKSVSICYILNSNRYICEILIVFSFIHL